MNVAQQPSVRNTVSEELKVARKTFVIDTNVLVHDSSSIRQFKDNEVVIPLIVLEELDGLKRNSDEVGKNAREVIRYIDSLKAVETGDLHAGVVIPEGPRVRLHRGTAAAPVLHGARRFRKISYGRVSRGGQG